MADINVRLGQSEAIKVLSDLHNMVDFDFLLKLAKRFVGS